MKTRTILALIGLAATLAGFCLPWLDFYGPISGVGAVRIAWPALAEGAGWTSPWFVLLALIPPLAVSIAYLVHSRIGKVMSAFLFVALNLLTAFAGWGILQYVGVHGVLYGYILMVAGILLLHVAAVIKSG